MSQASAWFDSEQIATFAMWVRWFLTNFNVDKLEWLIVDQNLFINLLTRLNQVYLSSSSYLSWFFFWNVKVFFIEWLFESKKLFRKWHFCNKKRKKEKFQVEKFFFPKRAATAKNFNLVSLHIFKSFASSFSSINSIHSMSFTIFDFRIMKKTRGNVYWIF